MIRQAVGQTPVMLGKRLKTQYFMENAYVEADIDISANATAAGVTSMVAGSIKSLVFDIGILLEVCMPDLLRFRLYTIHTCYPGIAAPVQLLNIGYRLAVGKLCSSFT